MDPRPGKPANEFKNTIDVQLNLLKGSEVDKFNKTVLQFQTAVNALQVLGTVADRIGAAAGNESGSPHKAGTSGSQYTAPRSTQTPPTPEEQRQASEANQGRLEKLQDKLNTGAYSYLQGTESTKLMQNLFLRGELKDWRYKDVAGLAAYGLGHAYYRNADKDNPTGSGKLLGAAAGFAGLEAAGGGTHVLRRVMNALRFQGPTTFGSNAGLSATGMGPGFLPNRIWSPAAQNYYSNYWNALKNSDFGFNLNYSTGQGVEAGQLINQFGYGSNPNASGSMRTTFRNVASGIPAINQSQIMQMMDMGFRYGASSIGEMQRQMMQIPAAAKAAQLGVTQFTDQLISTAAGLAQQSGAPASIISQQLMGMSSATGLAPALAGGVMGDQLLTNITAARLGGNFFKAANSPYAGAYRMQTVQSMIENVAGTSWKNLQHLQKTNQPAYQRILNRLQIVYNSPGGKQIFGNLSPTNINAMIARGQSPGQFQMAADALQFATDHKNTRNSGVESIATIMRNLGMSHEQQQQFLQQNTGSYQNKITALTKVEQTRQDAMNRRQHSQTVRLALTPNAAKLLQIVPDTNPARGNQQTPVQQAVQNNDVTPYLIK